MKIIRPKLLGADDFTISEAEAEGPQWDAVTDFALNDTVVRDHRVYVSAIAGNQGIDPLLEDQSVVGTRWVFKSFTNAHAFRDGVLHNKTLAGDSLTLTIQNVLGVDALLMFGVIGSTMQVTGKTIGGVEVYSEDRGLSGREVKTWWDYFHAEFEDFTTSILLTNIPANVDTLEIEITGTTIELGEIVLGDLLTIGQTQFSGTEGSTIGMSTVNFNQYGNLNLVQRPSRTEMKYRVFTDAQRWRSVKPALDRLDGLIVAAIGSENRPSTINLGVFSSVRWAEDHVAGYWFTFKLIGVS
jgi:hypothetical protein